MSDDSSDGSNDVVVIVGRSTAVLTVANSFMIGDTNYGTLSEALAMTQLGIGDPVSVEIPEASPFSVESFVELAASLSVTYPRQQSDLDEAALTVNGVPFHAISIQTLDRDGIKPASSSHQDEPWVFVAESDITEPLGSVSTEEEGAMISGAWESSVSLLASGSVLIQDRDADSSERYLFIIDGNYNRVSAVQQWLAWLEPHIVGAIKNTCGPNSDPAAADEGSDGRRTGSLSIDAQLSLTDDEQRQLWGS